MGSSTSLNRKRKSVLPTTSASKRKMRCTEKKKSNKKGGSAPVVSGAGEGFVETRSLWKEELRRNFSL